MAHSGRVREEMKTMCDSWYPSSAISDMQYLTCWKKNITFFWPLFQISGMSQTSFFIVTEGALCLGQKQTITISWSKIRTFGPPNINTGSYCVYQNISMETRYRGKVLAIFRNWRRRYQACVKTLYNHVLDQTTTHHVLTKQAPKGYLCLRKCQLMLPCLNQKPVSFS